MLSSSIHPSSLGQQWCHDLKLAGTKPCICLRAVVQRLLNHPWQWFYRAWLWQAVSMNWWSLCGRGPWNIHKRMITQRASGRNKRGPFNGFVPYNFTQENAKLTTPPKTAKMESVKNASVQSRGQKATAATKPQCIGWHHVHPPWPSLLFSVVTCSPESSAEHWVLLSLCSYQPRVSCHKHRLPIT